MNTALTKEKVLLFLSALLLAWVAFRLGVFATQRAATPGPPALDAYSCQQGDADLAGSLAIPPLSGYLGPGDPFRLAERTPRIVRPPHVKRLLDWAAIRAEAESQLAAARDSGKGRRTKIVIVAADFRGQGTKKRKVPGGEYARPLPPPPSRSFDLAGTLRLESPGAVGWALLRDRATRALLSGTVGDLLPGTLRLHAIRDDGATLITPQGTQITLPGRVGSHSQP